MNINDAELDQAIKEAWDDPEYQELCEFFDGHDEEFYTGLRVAIAVRIIREKDMISTKHQ